MLIHPLVTDTETLAALCERLAQADFVTVDTEFMRESTYYPDLCLVQVASPTEVHTYGGSVGLAPEWATSPCGWITIWSWGLGVRVSFS